MPVINININAVVKYTAKLETLRKSALPNAIRGTLNDAAFDVKTKTMPVQSKAKFINRSPNFFKANSRAEKATGFDVRTMKSVVGFTDTGLRGENNFSVKDLEEQEHSGDIDKKSFIPLDTARVGGSYNQLVKPANRLTKIKNIVVANKLGGQSKKQQFIKAIYKAGVGGYVLGGNEKGENILWRVDSIDSGNDLKKFSLTPLYDFRKSRSIHVKETGFMRIASMNSAEKMNKFYIAQSEFWIKKYAK
jgi:hypothetical protein